MVWIWFVAVALFVWGGFAYLLYLAAKKERGRD